MSSGEPEEKTQSEGNVEGSTDISGGEEERMVGVGCVRMYQMQRGSWRARATSKCEIWVCTCSLSFVVVDVAFLVGVEEGRGPWSVEIL